MEKTSDSPVEILKSVHESGKIASLRIAELNKVKKLLARLQEDVNAQIVELKQRTEDDDEYIEVYIDGKKDSIKKSIKVLNISCNSFSTLPPVFYRLNNLEKLYLFNNNFTVEEKRKIRRRFPASVQIYF